MRRRPWRRDGVPMILQLDPPIPLLTPRGRGLAHLVIDPGVEHSLQWVCFIDATGECWTYRNEDVRMPGNETMARPSPFQGESSI